MAIFKLGKVVMTSLFKKPATLMYPVIPRQWQERTRGHISIVEKDCILCSICSKRCPTHAITVDREGRTWTINRMDCVQCGSCAALVLTIAPKNVLLWKTNIPLPVLPKPSMFMTSRWLRKKWHRQQRKPRWQVSLHPEVGDNFLIRKKRSGGRILMAARVRQPHQRNQKECLSFK